MESKAICRYIRIAPRKMKLVADIVRGKKVNDALSQLHFLPKRSSVVVEKTIRSALANMMDREEARDIDIDDALISEIRVNEGPTWKRFRPRAMGRASRIRKRTSHLYVTLTV
ncbi:50S ribosomal protein L22 [candidate division LCP-89 bacterium B3_LCP]|uniref:Large ribosomal subunit protein uL22 n=1 Tax=candidate division LCP-89 bacterium B3_LCP TaxID=2012998 RepID=A0A532UZP0_UNCL8|nr:MAG: 50S ribosomal protein L22 [candidate division LCP-89 bacterium B3_LCP]